MSNNPFSNDYAGMPPARVVAAPIAIKPAVVTAATHEKPARLLSEQGFEITPIPTISGKPKRVIIRGKVTSD